MDDAQMAAVTAAGTQLVLHEREGRDRGWWEQMQGAFAWAGLGPPGSAGRNERVCGAGPRR